MTITHTYSNALKESTKYFDGNELAAKVFVDKYALRNADEKLIELTPTDMHWRMAKEFARIEKDKFGEAALTAQEIFDVFDKFQYIVPQGGAMSGIGNHKIVSLSNCYLVDTPVDSYGGILHTDEQLVHISKRRGGCGTDLSHLRPNGAITHNSAGSSTGVVAFANRFSNTIREVGQQGRRGALALTLDVHHPDISEFIACKADKTKVTGANLSVRLSDEFLKAAQENKDYEQRWPCDSDSPTISRKVSANKVWNEIVTNAHEHAEPCILFWNRVLSESPADCYEEFKTRGINPCSEIFLSPLDSCRLLLLNTLGFVDNPYTPGAKFNFAKFYKYAGIAQRLMDDLVDLEIECIEKIIKKVEGDPEADDIKDRELKMWQRILKNCKAGRRTGTGITALGDTIAAIGLAYSSKEGIEFTGRLYKTLKFGCYASSIDMAERLGPFPVFDSKKELEHGCAFFERFSKETCNIKGESTAISGDDLMAKMHKIGRRNIACLTTAPGGSVSMLTQTTSGIEPLYFPSSIRRKKGSPGDEGFRSDFVDDSGDHWMEFEVIHPQISKWMEVTGETDITKSPWHNNCAEDLDWKMRVELQGVAQEHICHGISSTINVPAESTVEDIKLIYETAHAKNCKGITVYRKGCRDGVILEKGVDNSASYAKIEVDIPRPKVIPCNVHHTSIKGQSYFVLVGLLDGKPHEVFAGKNGFIPARVKTGTITRKRKNFYIAKFDNADCDLSPITAATGEMEEVVTRLTSLSLRAGADMHLVVQQLEKVGEQQALHGFARCVARILKKYIPDGTPEGEKCPECSGSALIRQEGCVNCAGCGYSKCL